MLEFIPHFLQDFFEEFTNPQKRIFVGYLMSAFVLALVWLCIAERDSAKAAIKKIFDKNVWLSTLA